MRNKMITDRHKFLLELIQGLPFQETPRGGGKKRGEEKLTKTPLSKKGLGPPSYGTFSTPQVSLLCLSCAKIHDLADQKLFWKGPKSFVRIRLSSGKCTENRFGILGGVRRGSEYGGYENSIFADFCRF